MAINAGASALGLVANMPSGPGVIKDELIRKITAACPQDIDTFLLSSRTSATDIIEHVKYCGTNTLQLVDKVDKQTHRIIKQSLPHIKLVQVIHVENDTAIDEAMSCEDNIDMLLLDSGRPGSKVKQLGGTGRVHNWDISREIVRQSKRPVFLAGGLNPDNAAQAVQKVGAYGLDICSGVRVNERLDKNLLERFIRATRH